MGCKEGRTYDKNSEMCKKCYAAGRLQAKMAEAIMAKMSTKQLEDLLMAGVQSANIDDDDDNPKTMN